MIISLLWWSELYCILYYYQRLFSIVGTVESIHRLAGALYCALGEVVTLIWEVPASSHRFDDCCGLSCIVIANVLRGSVDL